MNDLNVGLFIDEVISGGVTDVDDLYLEHHGVKGMKWGVRKDLSSGNSLAKQKAKAAKKEFRRDVRKLSRAQRKDLRRAGNSTPNSRKVHNDISKRRPNDKVYANRVRKSANRRTSTILAGQVAVTVLAMNPAVMQAGFNFIGKSGKTAQNMADSIKTRRRGAQFAKDHGIDMVQYIDEKGRRLKNFSPKF